MPAIRSELDPTSEDFLKNQAAMWALITDLRTLSHKISLGGSEAARNKHIARNKLLPRDRIAALIDSGSPFLEFSALAAHNVYDDEVPAAGIITGIGRIEGTECVIVCNDSTVKGGAYGEKTSARPRNCPAKQPAVRLSC